MALSNITATYNRYLLESQNYLKTSLMQISGSYSGFYCAGRQQGKVFKH